MKCFNHRDSDAVGLCKSCCRALCPDCIIEVDKGISCKERCEEEVSILNDLVARGKTAYQKTSSVYTKSGVFILLMGLGFIVFGLMADKNGPFQYFLAGMGVLFLGWSFSYFFTAKKYREK